MEISQGKIPVSLPLSQTRKKCHFFFFFYKIREQKGRVGPAWWGRGHGTSGRERWLRKGVRG
jgi:hypothetical protein